MKCKNCGNDTHMANAVPERERKGWCKDCYSFWKKRADPITGEITSDNVPTYVRTTPYDARPPQPQRDSE